MAIMFGVVALGLWLWSSPGQAQLSSVTVPTLQSPVPPGFFQLFPPPGRGTQPPANQPVLPAAGGLAGRQASFGGGFGMARTIIPRVQVAPVRGGGVGGPAAFGQGTPRRSGRSTGPTVQPPARPTREIAREQSQPDPEELRKRIVAFQQRNADRGLATAQYDLGRRYLEGDGTAPDAVKARQWLALAAGQGHRQARELLDQLGPAVLIAGHRR